MLKFSSFDTKITRCLAIYDILRFVLAVGLGFDHNPPAGFYMFSLHRNYLIARVVHEPEIGLLGRSQPYPLLLVDLVSVVFYLRIAYLDYLGFLLRLRRLFLFRYGPFFGGSGFFAFGAFGRRKFFLIGL